MGSSVGQDSFTLSSCAMGLHPGCLRLALGSMAKAFMSGREYGVGYIVISLIYNCGLTKFGSFVCRSHTLLSYSRPTLERSEFGNVLVYALTYTIPSYRVRTGYYTTEKAKRVRSILNLMVVYPLVYVICTIPLASARMASMSGRPPTLARLCLSGAMITSNGWLDVLLYTCTPRIPIFSDETPSDENGLNTFATFWIEEPKCFGGGCTVNRLRRPGEAEAESRYGVGVTAQMIFVG
jgi:hypothetical protein